MMILCPRCNHHYDESENSTACPHPSLIPGQESLQIHIVARNGKVVMDLGELELVLSVEHARIVAAAFLKEADLIDGKPEVGQ